MLCDDATKNLVREVFEARKAEIIDDYSDDASNPVAYLVKDDDVAVFIVVSPTEKLPKEYLAQTRQHVVRWLLGQETFCKARIDLLLLNGKYKQNIY